MGYICTREFDLNQDANRAGGAKNQPQGAPPAVGWGRGYSGRGQMGGYAGCGKGGSSCSRGKQSGGAFGFWEWDANMAGPLSDTYDSTGWEEKEENSGCSLDHVKN